MPAKKKSEPEVARSATSSDVPKNAKRLDPKTPSELEAASEGAVIVKKQDMIQPGDWVMFASPLFVQLHLVAKPRSKENVVAACGIANPPDFTGRPKGPRCKYCTVLHAEVVKPKVVA